MKDLDQFMTMPKWDVIAVEQAWRYVTGIKVHFKKSMTIQVTVTAAYLRHHQYNQPILGNYRDLISQDIASSHFAAARVEQDADTNDEEPQHEGNEGPCPEETSPDVMWSGNQMSNNREICQLTHVLNLNFCLYLP